MNKEHWLLKKARHTAMGAVEVGEPAISELSALLDIYIQRQLVLLEPLLEVSTEPIPFIGFSNEILEMLPPIHAGENILCPHCGKEHEVGESEPPGVQFYKCGESVYLAGFKNRQVVNTKPDVSGRL